jgi:hypothetical protein
VTNADGNLSKIVRFFLTENPADPTAPFMQAVRVWAAALVDPFGPGLHFAVGGLLAREASTPVVALALFIVALLIAAGWRTRGPAPHPSPLPASGARESASPLPFEGRGQGEGSQLVDAWFCRICAVASLAAMFAMTGVRQGYGDYMVIWISAIGVMNGAALMAWLFTSIASRVATVPVRIVPGRWVRWIVPIVTCTVLIAATTHGALDLERLRAERAAAARSGDFRVRGESIYVALRAFLAKARVRRPLIRVAGTWDNASALALQLHKRRQPVAISDDAIWLVGPQFKRDGTEDADLTLADRSERQAVTARDGDCMLIERHGLSLHVLVPSLHTTITLTCE